MPLSLPDVTLCAVTSINHDLTVRAMNKCLEQCSFADVVLVSSQPIEAPFRVEVVPPFTGIEYAPFVCKNLTKYTSSSYNLLVQYDGYIVDPFAWNDKFFDYDYIGAKWPWQVENRRVGNSGFCLRSKRLLDIVAEMVLPPTGEFVDDKFICHTMREHLERDHGIKIAPDEIADLFSYERHIPNQPTFGFHGIFNFWRHTEDQEMKKVVSLLDDFYITSRGYADILFYYHEARKFKVFYDLYARLRQHVEEHHIKEHLLQFLHDTKFIDELIKSGESLDKFYGKGC